MILMDFLSLAWNLVLWLFFGLLPKCIIISFFFGGDQISIIVSGLEITNFFFFWLF